MKIIVIGTGYVGLVTGACLADIGHDVACIDIDEEKINNLNRGIIPIYEPILSELVLSNFKLGRLQFSCNLEEILADASIVFIAVGTPTKENGEADISQVFSAAHAIGKNLSHYSVIVNKSTVPIGTAREISEIIKQYYDGFFDVISNPEFLREGSAVKDFLSPDRIVIGIDDSDRAKKVILEVFRNFNSQILITDTKSAEMIKYASNAFLATSISFINSIAGICESAGADITSVAEGMMLDKRIGKQAFLYAGCGYGGSCFPKDVNALIKIGQQHGVRFNILEEVEHVNEKMKISLFHKLKQSLPDLNGKKIAIWGLAFKPNTDDIRFSPAQVIIEKLLSENAVIQVHDPVAMENFKKIFPNIGYFSDPYSVVKDASALMIVTDWPQFIDLDFELIKSSMQGNLILDGRNILDEIKLKRYGFIYKGIGK
ncbi:UDP-glucose/GDP-mannose dehydrogenase family protein [Patescibacteria group bacterium]|nr:UDP-glucose/GDP-mannose dehydrogenase family protein [Patescibacteria group bacterium]